MSDTSLNGILFLTQDLTTEVVCASIERLKDRFPTLELSTLKKTICTEFSSPISRLDRARPQHPCYLEMNEIEFTIKNLRAVKSFHFVDKGSRQAMIFVGSMGDTFQSFIDDPELGKWFMDVFGTLACSIGAYFGFLGHEYSIFSPSDNFEVRGTNYVEELLVDGRYSTFYLGDELIDKIGRTDLDEWAYITKRIESGGAVFSIGDMPFVGGVNPTNEFYRDRILRVIFNRLRKEYPN